MSTHQTTFEYPDALQEYMVTESEFYVKNPQYNMMCCGAVIFNNEGKLLLVRRANTEQAFPNCWEIPGGKVDDTDETILHAVAREVKEETGMDVTRVVRKVTEFGWEDYHARRARHEVWTKLIFEVEVKNLDVVLDPIEHQDYVFATEEEVVADQVGAGVSLSWISPTNKEVNLEAFRLRRAEAMPKATGAS